MLTISNLTYRIANRPIFENAGARIAEGWRVGIVGANGAGKSTLFKLITDELSADGGDISLHEKYSIGIVKQDIPDSDKPLLDIVLEADEERTRLLQQSETETDPYKLLDIYERLTDIDAYAAPAKASMLLSGLGFSEDQLSEPISSFSGGWRMRVALAAALFQEPDFLLLDEPTNHLDLEAIMWLENYLASYPHTLMIISHDRDLLNTCCDHILHVDRQDLTLYKGNYDTFESERAAKMMNQQKLHEKQAAQRAHMEAFVNRFKAKASKAKQAQSRLKALEKMTVVDAVMADRTVKFQFSDAPELAPPIFSLNQASVGYTEGQPILINLNERIDPDDRIALLGANGNGKSTLMKLLAGKLTVMDGDLQKANKLKIGYFSQHQSDELNMDETPYIQIARKLTNQPEARIRAKLGQFGFSKELSDNKIASLSGGEKARLLFAIMSCDAPHLLLMDEPTNHLDMDSREALVQALNAYNGAVVLVSHDPSMLSRVADRLWLVHGGKCQPFDGDLQAYRDHIITQRRQEKRDKKASSAQAIKQSQKDRKKAFPALFKAAEKAEKDLNKLLKKQKDIQMLMGEASFYDDAENAQKIQADYADLTQKITAQEETWLTAQDAFETAE